MFKGERLRRIREERGWSQERLGKVIGVSRSAISKIEKGTVADPKAVQIKKMAEALGVSAEWLAGWTDARTAPGGKEKPAEKRPGTAGAPVPAEAQKRALSPEEAELLRVFRELDVRGRTALLSDAFALEENRRKEGDR